jgi:hypothetical protein
MPLTPEEAAAAVASSPEVQALVEEIDEQVREKGEATVWDAFVTYGNTAVQQADKIYSDKGWAVSQQRAGQRDDDEGLFIRPKS